MTDFPDDLVQRAIAARKSATDEARKRVEAVRDQAVTAGVGMAVGAVMDHLFETVVPEMLGTLKDQSITPEPETPAPTQYTYPSESHIPSALATLTTAENVIYRLVCEGWITCKLSDRATAEMLIAQLDEAGYVIERN